MSAETPFDPGLQPERTLLAWRRTALTLAVASAVEVRLVADQLGALAIGAGLGGLVLSAWVWVTAAARYRRAHHSLVDDGSLGAAGGRSIATLAASATLVSVVALIWIVVNAQQESAGASG